MAKKKKISRRATLDGFSYSGVLAEPIKIDHSLRTPKSTFPSDEEIWAAESDFRRELNVLRRKKLDELFNFYLIVPTEPNAMAKLGWELACAHVAGFQAANPSGAPRRKISDFVVCGEVYGYLRRNPGRSITFACTALTRPKAALEGFSSERVRRIYASRDRAKMRRYESFLKYADDIS